MAIVVQAQGNENLRSRAAYAEAAWDWGIFNHCLHGKRRISDVDGILTSAGHFLILEVKPPRKQLATGQRLTFLRLSAVPGCSVLIMWGERNRPEEFILRGELAAMHGGDMSESAPCNLASMQALVAEWETRWGDL